MPYRDSSNAGLPVLDSQRVDTAIVCKRIFGDTLVHDPDSFIMESDYIALRELDDPVFPRTISPLPQFNYSRSQPGFEDVNAYFHIQNYRQHVIRLGFDALPKYLIQADAHGEYSDNSQFIPVSNTDLELLFGVGGVDDAEDADVIVHEYTHSLSHSASPNTVRGLERSSMEEGLCDYFACSFSAELSDFHQEWCYNWDGHNQYWRGRTCTTTKIYPKDIDGNIYQAGEIWSGALFPVRLQIGRDSCDKLVLEFLYHLAPNMSMKSGAKVIDQLDSMIFHKSYRNLFREQFHERKIFSDSEYLDIQTIADVSGHNEIYTIDGSRFSTESILTLSAIELRTVSASLSDINGRLIDIRLLKVNGSKTNSYGQLSPGIYLFTVQDGQGDKTDKFLK